MATLSTNAPITTLRQRMQHDLLMRGLGPQAQLSNSQSLKSSTGPLSDRTFSIIHTLVPDRTHALNRRCILVVL